MVEQLAWQPSTPMYMALWDRRLRLHEEPASQQLSLHCISSRLLAQEYTIRLALQRRECRQHRMHVCSCRQFTAFLKVQNVLFSCVLMCFPTVRQISSPALQEVFCCLRSQSRSGGNNAVGSRMQCHTTETIASSTNQCCAILFLKTSHRTCGSKASTVNYLCYHDLSGMLTVLRRCANTKCDEKARCTSRLGLDQQTLSVSSCPSSVPELSFIAMASNHASNACFTLPDRLQMRCESRCQMLQSLYEPHNASTS